MNDPLLAAGCHESKSKRKWKPAIWNPEYFSCPDRPSIQCVKVRLKNGSDLIMDQSDWSVISRLRICGWSRGYALCTAFKQCPNTSGVVHRIIAALMFGGAALKTELGARVNIDHANGDPSDNRRCNLRLCNHAENMRNQSAVKGSSRFKGVYESQTPGKWKANITYTRPGFPRSIHLGTFSTEEDAARAYDAKVRELFGEFAKTNEDLGLFKASRT